MSKSFKPRPRPTKSYIPRPIKKLRRSKTEINLIKSDIYDVLEKEQPMTIRHLFYRLVSKGFLEKTEAQYKGTLVRLLTEMRRQGEIPFEWLVDSTRWVRQPNTHHSIFDALEECKQTYRRALWSNQPVYAEVWCEKDSIASILAERTYEFDVPLMVCRGFSSLSFIHSAAENIKAQGKPTYIFYFGDHDPSGKSISSALERDLRQFSDGAEINFERVTVTEQQIDDWDLPTRPTKKTDTRSKSFVGESVEIDAISAGRLQTLVNDAIVELINPDAYQTIKRIEKSERESLRWLTDNFRRQYQQN